MKSSFVRSVTSVASLFVIIIFAVACNKSDNNTPNQPVSGLMAFNLSPDKTVSVALSGNPLTNAPLEFTSYTGNYLSVFTGSRNVQSFDNMSGNALDSATFTFEPEKYYSLFVTGVNGNYHNVIVNDVFDTVTTGKALVRYVNAIPDSTAPTVTIVSNGENVANNSAPFGSVSSFSAVSAGDVNIQVNNGGNVNKSRTITLEQQKAYTVLLAGIPGSTAGDSLQIRFIENGSLQQKAQKSSSASSANSN